MLTSMGDVLRECYKRGWITTRDGNVSFRKRGGSKLYITPSGVRKTIVHPEHIVKLDIIAGRLIVAGNPSGEIKMHEILQLGSPETRVVLHAHPTHIVAAMYAGLDLQEISSRFPEIYRYTKVGPNVPNYPALSMELAIQTSINLGLTDDGSLLHDIVGQANHGATSVGKTAWDAFEHMERLEHICEIVLKSGVKP